MPSCSVRTGSRSPGFEQAPSKGRKGRKPKRTRKRKDPTAGLQVANPNAAAIDIGCAEHWVAVPPGGQKDHPLLRMLHAI